MATVIDSAASGRPLSMDRIFYVYAHVRIDSGNIFYIGKGKGNRAWVKARRNAHWQNIVNKSGFRVEFIKKDITEADAIALEIKSIAIIGLGNLCNMTDGGDGISGYKMTEDQKRILVKNLTGRKLSEETRGKISKGNSGKKRTKSTVKAHAEALRGRKHSDSHVEKIRKALTGRPVSLETREKISSSNSGRVATIESRAVMSKAHIGKARSKESRSKQSLTMKEKASKNKIGIYGAMMKRVSCSNGMIFSSLSDASEWAAKVLDASSPKGSIGRCAKGDRKSAYGLFWSYT